MENNTYTADRRIALEICTGDPQGVIAAIEGGADRVELCSGLSEGGVTPSEAMIRFSSERIDTNVLIRPRAGDFVYNEDEVRVMEEDVKTAIRLGAKGVVVGALTAEGKVDPETCRRLIGNAEGHENTFHRAFDLTDDPFEALEEIIRLGFARILTSGQAATALDGASLIARLKEKAAGRILILAGAGVTGTNAGEIIRLSHADEIHASARSRVGGKFHHKSGASMGSADAADGSRLATDAYTVKAIRNAIDKNNYLS